MKSFKALKALFCLIFTFVFMFGNVLFVNAAVIEVEERAELITFQDDINVFFTGTITYTCSDPYGNKKITKVNDISLTQAYSWEYRKVVFEQQGVDPIDITGNGTMVTAYVNGKLTLYPYQADEDNDCCDEDADEDNHCYVEYVKIPVNYNL